MSPSEIVEQNANRFEMYKDYGLTYDKTTDCLYYNGELVRFFEDVWPLDENSSSALTHFTENGTVDIHTVRDFSQLKQNPDGSIDPSGKLSGVEPYSQAEFSARHIEELKNPTKSSSTTYAATAVSNVDSQSSSQNNNSQYTVEKADATDSKIQPSDSVTSTIILDGPTPTPDEMADMLSIYKPFGVTYDKGTGGIYYDGKLVSLLTDTLTLKGEIQGLTSYGDPNGIVHINTVRDSSQQDANGYDKLIGIEVAGD